MLHYGILRPSEVKKLQKALILLGYKLNDNENNNNGLDGNFGELTENAVLQFQTDMGYSEENIDGIVGLYTLNGLINELNPVLYVLNVDSDKATSLAFVPYWKLDPGNPAL